jgi:hypothetical protein
MAKLTDDDLLAIIRSKSTSFEKNSDHIRLERETALNYYRQDPFGNEQDGRSQVVTSDVRDTIEWMLPQLIEVFLGPDAPCEFKPQSKDDIDAAKQETKYVRYVFNEQNDGFLNLYTWIKDALMYKNSVIKCYWNDDEEETEEDYENINIVELEMLKAEKALTIKKIIPKIDGEKVKEADLKGITIDRISYDIKAIRTEDISKIDIQPVAPENFILDPNYTSVDLAGCDFCQEDAYLTETELLREGFDRDLIDSLPTYNPTIKTETQNRFLDQGGLVINNSNSEKANRKIKISDVYITVDINGDGKAERRFVKIGGDDTILENEPCDYIPYRALTPIIMTHKFTGMSVAELVMDLQLLKSTLWRQSLDSLYLSNNPRYTVLTGQVELDDLLVSRPGGIIRQKTLGAVGTLETPFVGANSLPMIEVVDKMKEERTGVSSVSQGLSPDTLADSTNMMGAMIMNASQARIKMIARIFAETGYKSLMLLIHELTLKYEKNEKIAELGDGEYIPINPSEWKKRKDMTVKVGVGYADRNQKVASLERILNMQQQIFTGQGGEGALLNSTNIYNAVNDLMELTGMDSRDRYFSDPKKYKAPKKPPSVQDRTVDVADAEVTLQASKAAAEHDYDVEKLNQDNRFRYIELMQKDKLERDKLKLQENTALGNFAMEAIREGKEYDNMAKEAQPQQGTADNTGDASELVIE